MEVTYPAPPVIRIPMNTAEWDRGWMEMPPQDPSDPSDVREFRLSDGQLLHSGTAYYLEYA